MQKGGTKALWEELYEEHYKELVAFGTHMSGSRELAEDLVQETFVRALMNAQTVEELSGSKRRAALESEYLQSCRSECAEDQGMQEVENAMLLQNLAPQDRAVFQLRYFDGYSAEEISRMLDLPPGTVRSKLSRTRKFLKNLDL